MPPSAPTSAQRRQHDVTKVLAQEGQPGCAGEAVVGAPPDQQNYSDGAQQAGRPPNRQNQLGGEQVQALNSEWQPSPPRRPRKPAGPPRAETTMSPTRAGRAGRPKPPTSALVKIRYAASSCQSW